MKCPICDKEIQDHKTEYMEHILMEEHAKCQDEHHFYSYEYVTGNGCKVIGNVIFIKYHSTPREEKQLQNKQYEAVLQLEREYYQKKRVIKRKENATNE